MSPYLTETHYQRVLSNITTMVAAVILNIENMLQLLN